MIAGHVAERRGMRWVPEYIEVLAPLFHDMEQQHGLASVRWTADEMEFVAGEQGIDDETGSADERPSLGWRVGRFERSGQFWLNGFGRSRRGLALGFRHERGSAYN